MWPTPNNISQCLEPEISELSLAKVVIFLFIPGNLRKAVYFETTDSAGWSQSPRRVQYVSEIVCAWNFIRHLWLKQLVFVFCLQQKISLRLKTSGLDMLYPCSAVHVTSQG